MFNFQQAVKKPIPVSVLQLTNDVWEAIYRDPDHCASINGYGLVADIIEEDYLYPDEQSVSGVAPVAEEVKCFFVNTLEDVGVNKLHKAKIDDWLIMGIKGEIYACDKDIFEKTYTILKEVNYND